MGEQLRHCAKCGRSLPLNMFHKENNRNDGLFYWCKECQSAYGKKYRQDNLEELRAKDREYAEKHRAENREAINARRRELYHMNKQHYKDKAKKYYEKHKKQFKEYYVNNREQLLADSTRWSKENPEKVKVLNERRRSRKNALPATLTAKQWERIKNHFNNSCAYCGKEDDLQQEHFIPLSKGGEYTHNNIIPVCKSCNCSKNNQDFFKWYPQQKYYSKKRERDILKFLHYKENTQQLSLII